MTRNTLIAATLVALGAGSLMVYPSSAQEPPLTLTQLTWFDRGGKQLSTVGPLADHGNIELSPDGRRIAAAIAERGSTTRHIWIYEPDGTRTQLTSDTNENWAIWSPDGERMALNSFSNTRRVLVQRQVRGTARPTDLLDDETGKWPVSWSPDGSRILFVTDRERTGNDIWVLPLTGAQRPYAFSDTGASENWATFSPDGRMVAYSSTEPTGTAEVYVAPIPGDGRMWRISADGGTQARWRRQNEILYLDQEGTLVSAPLRFEGKDLIVGALTPLFALKFPYASYHAFDVTPDGSRVLVNTVIVSPTAPKLSVSNRE